MAKQTSTTRRPYTVLRVDASGRRGALVARARLPFRYTDIGPVGLLTGKKAYLVASGGVPVGSAADLATPYMRHVLGFLGIHDVEVIEAGRLNVDASAPAAAHEQVHHLIAANDSAAATAAA